jgi:acyl-CoA thioesterase
MATLRDVYTPRPIDGRYQLEIVPGWRQGRGAFGGLIVGALVSAIEHTIESTIGQQPADARRRARSVTAEIPGPVEHGTVDITVESLRHGKNVSTLRAALVQQGEIKSHAVAIVAAPRPSVASVAWNDLPRPEPRPWAEVAPLVMQPSGAWPEFAQHFEYRLVEEAPRTGGPAQVLGWIRPRDPGPRCDAAFLAAVIDAWWPAALLRFGAWRPMATIAFTLDVVAALDQIDPAAPLIYRAAAPVCGDGMFLETRELWTADGQLLALNHQTFAIIQ